MTHKRSITRVGAAVCLSALMVGAAGKPKPAAPAADSLNIQGQGSGGTFVYPDPKTLGKPQLKVFAKNFSAKSLVGGFQGDLLGVSAWLFQHGVLTAKLTAPRVKGDNLQDLLVASGRVTVKSYVQPGTVLQADTMRWYPKTNKLYADGHVFYRDGKTGATVNTPHMQADTALKEISSGG